VRVSALSRFRVLYVMTHDSIGLGEVRAITVATSAWL
jgi:hypothetical protein